MSLTSSNLGVFLPVFASNQLPSSSSSPSLPPSSSLITSNNNSVNDGNNNNNNLTFKKSIMTSSTKPVEFDRFGIKEIYPTKQGGREWFLDMNNPATNNSDTAFSITSSHNHNLTKQNDSSWRISGRAVRLNVDTPLLAVPWKNIEITGYVKVLSKVLTTTNSSQNNTTGSNNNNTEFPTNEGSESNGALNWYARGDRHSSRFPCEGTAYHGILRLDGTAGWEKEIWHTGGYTSERDKVKVTNSIIGRWIGWKVVMYNIKNDTQVKLESYLDDKNNNNWVKVTELVDNGGWYTSSLDKEFYSANCGKVKDYIITNSGLIATFRSDNVIWDFKNLSMREIQPPS